jgi:hypothetical protein
MWSLPTLHAPHHLVNHPAPGQTFRHPGQPQSAILASVNGALALDKDDPARDDKIANVSAWVRG